MASGDTKTEALLNILGNGGDASDYRGCCNTKTQSYILDAIDRVQDVEDEVEELKNNPDVVDIVDTYADLQAYDTQHLSNNDIIRVLADETHSGNSTYYKFNKQADTWTFIGEIASAGGDIKTLSTDDYNYPTNNPDRVALWLLPNGLYRIPTSGVSVYYASNSIWTAGHGDFVIVEKYQAGAKPISMYFFGSTDGVEYCEVSTSGNLNRALAYTILSDRVSQSTGNDQYSVMSQNAVTSMIFSNPATATNISIGNSNAGTDALSIGVSAYGAGNYSIALGDHSNTYSGSEAIAIGHSARARKTGAIAIGYNTNDGEEGHIGSIALGAAAKTDGVGQLNIGTTSTDYGYNGNSNYRIIRGLYDGQSAHDAATLGQLNGRVLQNAGAPTTSTVGTVGQLLEDTTNGKLYQCTAIDTTDPNNPSYTWSEVGAGGGDMVYSDKSTSNFAAGGAVYIGNLNTDQTPQQDPTSTDNHYRYFWALPMLNNTVPSNSSINILGANSADYATVIGRDANAPSGFGINGVAIGYGATSRGDSSVALGKNAYVGNYISHSVALGDSAIATRAGEVNIGNTVGYGYNFTNYRVLGGVHDGQDVHDAATVAQGNTLATSAPTTSTIGVLGQLYTDTTGMHTYQLTSIDTTDPNNPSYTWTQRW